ncbi:hypothetical protein H1C71_041077 [Ictidomys tridecemlineatus]|nr:hypothetical protein H1C71_041077 [Ictidomys tridecemlineatus]
MEPNPVSGEEITFQKKAQNLPKIFPCGGPIIGSPHRPSAGGMPMAQADAEAAVLPEPDPSCSSLPDKWAKERLEKHHLPSSLGSQGSSKEVNGQKHSCGPSESCPPPRASTWRPPKRKKLVLMALPLWLPCYQDGLPPPANKPILCLEEDIGTLLREVLGAKKKKLKDDMEALEERREAEEASKTTLPVHSCSLPGTHSETIDILIPPPDSPNSLYIPAGNQWEFPKPICPSAFPIAK